MSSLEAALYNYALEESWDARLRKWTNATAQEITEQRTRIRDIRDRLLHLIQDADDEGNRDYATVTTYAYLQSKERLIIARQEQRQRRNSPDPALCVERDLLTTLIQLVEPHVPAASRLAMESYLAGQKALQESATESEEEAGEVTGDIGDINIAALLGERDRLAQRVEAMEEARRRLEVELGTYDPLAIIDLVRTTRDRLSEAERLLSPLALERDMLSREFGTFTATQIVGQVRLLKDKNGELNQQLRFARSRTATQGAVPAVEPAPSAPATPVPNLEWEQERERLEKLIATLEEALGMTTSTLKALPREQSEPEEELRALPRAA